MVADPLADSQPPRVPTGLRRYFVADLHLDGQDTPRALRFRELLTRLSQEAQTRPVELYILGDLFEFWYEYRSQVLDLYRADIAALTAAWEAGVKVFLFFGNRDFAYGRYVQRRFGGTVLGDGEQIALHDSRPAWLEHGDLLCTADRRYLRFRGIIRSWPVRLLFWLLPWCCASKLIERIRRRTAADKAAKPAATVAMDLDAARRRLEEKRCRVLLCGHTHQPRGEDLGAGYRLIVLPPWCDTPAGMVDDDRGFRPFSLEDE
ncbi:MAG: UDP-2,3-diacylglucosamine diphosphatase [Planctomycetota bacterium]|nr:UDP-2,3-diacylglucosamine diphosphatase [Planctomycetota bacterium]